MLTTHHEVKHVSRPRSRRPDASSDLGQTGRFVEPDARSTVVATYRQPIKRFLFSQEQMSDRVNSLSKRAIRATSAFPLKATELRTWRHVSKGQAEAKGLANFMADCVGCSRRPEDCKGRPSGSARSR